MPCWTRVSSKVEFMARSTDVGLLEEALAHLGYTVVRLDDGLRFSRLGRTGTYTASTGAMKIPEAWDSAAIKRGYSEAVVNKSARVNGWKIEWKTSEAGNRVATVLRKGGM